MNKLPEGFLAKYYQEFPEDKAIESMGLKLLAELEYYADEDGAKIDNQEYEQALAKLFEINLFLDKNLKLIKRDSELFNYFIENYNLFISGIREDAKELHKIISSSLYQKNLSFSEAFSAIISGVELKLTELEQALKTGGNFKELIASFVQELKDDSKNRSQNIQELGKAALKLNEAYAQFGQDVLSGISGVNKTESEVFDDQDKLKISLDNLGLDEYEERLLIDDFREHKKFSAERIKEMILYYQEMVEANSYSPEIMQMVRRDFDEAEIVKEQSKSLDHVDENNPMFAAMRKAGLI